MKINKILIANRGEIAIRVIKTCQEMGIKSVTIFSEEDRHLPHAYSADESYFLDGNTLAETYLNQDKIIAIAKNSGANAIHPGYGFLSENTDFCKKVNDNDLIFIGPSTDAIELMGDKKESKIAMEKLGIPLIPGYHGNDQSKKTLKEEATKIGFPVLIKATAGGGGKGMRIVESLEEFETALESAKREALNAFGNDQVLLEKYIINPRHIEVQLVSDGVGNHFHFFERECSIQRRYQKIIEETPSVALDSKLREDICSTAVKIASGINYTGAGTIEYILADDNKFYFLEMNTRLQVEHPVTEMVTGKDLVELQILAAAGLEFPFKQEDIKQIGHSVECRIYAEDPDNDFLPTNGKISKIGASNRDGVRLDTGYADNTNISTNYDPMIAKVIVHSADRGQALAKMDYALNDVLFSGVKTNRDYLKRVLKNDMFVKGDIHTHFVKEYENDLRKPDFTDDDLAKVVAAAIFSDTEYYGKTSWDSLTNFRNI